MKRIHLLPALAITLCCIFVTLVIQARNANEWSFDAQEVPSTDFSWSREIPPEVETTDISPGDQSLALRSSSPQDYQRGGSRRWRGRRRDPNDRGGVPLWKNEAADPGDVFTFVRIRYDSYRGRYRWNTDYPDADLNLSFRLQQLTSIKTDPNGKILRLTDEELFKYPFIYIIEPGGMTLSEAEVIGLRSYLDRGGFLMVDDFWGEDEWANFASEMKRVFPKRPIEDIPLEHEIFNIVYKIKKKPLIPSVHTYRNGGWTERWDAEEAHYRCIKDDSGRLMTVICHNTDLGDGWEQEGTDSGYFEEYSEPYAYPLGINIVTYAMTH